MYETIYVYSVKTEPLYPCLSDISNGTLGQVLETVYLWCYLLLVFFYSSQPLSYVMRAPKPPQVGYVIIILFINTRICWSSPTRYQDSCNGHRRRPTNACYYIISFIILFICWCWTRLFLWHTVFIILL